ncbi:hypothetical protein [Candidatus Cyanaurora vandensis]|uniref:hypothetical protein n=1 Tax=Candidatus Cyanaurora vandensis TaxID=2714958 RepID=UPI00257A1D63|nr:hypothetical protein [Candidatus Cyanaurora vandensis]
MNACFVTRLLAATLSSVARVAPIDSAPVQNFSVGTFELNQPRSVVSVDFDGDGDLDLATANQDTHSNNRSVLFNITL